MILFIIDFVLTVSFAKMSRGDMGEFMFKVDDYVVHNTMGVNRITEFLTEEQDGEEVEFFILEPAFGGNMRLKLPKKGCEDKIRDILTREEVEELIASIPDQESIWIDEDKVRYEEFRACLKTGACENWVALIKTLNQKKEERENIGKQLTRVDADVLKAAEKNLTTELAVVLNMTPEEVLPYIYQQLPVTESEAVN